MALDIPPNTQKELSRIDAAVTAMEARAAALAQAHELSIEAIQEAKDKHAAEVAEQNAVEAELRDAFDDLIAASTPEEVQECRAAVDEINAMLNAETEQAINAGKAIGVAKSSEYAADQAQQDARKAATAARIALGLAVALVTAAQVDPTLAKAAMLAIQAAKIKAGLAVPRRRGANRRDDGRNPRPGDSPFGAGNREHGRTDSRPEPVRNEPPRNDSPRNEPPRNEPVRNEPVRNEGPGPDVRPR